MQFSLLFKSRFVGIAITLIALTPAVRAFAKSQAQTVTIIQPEKAAPATPVSATRPPTAPQEAIAPATTGSEAPTQTVAILSLKDAAEMVLQSNPQLREKKEHINEMASDVPVARAKLMPTISFSTTASRAKDALISPYTRFEGNPYNQYQTDLKVTQPLLAIGSLSAIDSTKLDNRISVLDAKITKRTLLDSLIQAYYQVIMTTRNLQILQDEFKIMHESFKTAAHRALIGRSQVLDALTTKTQLALLDSQISDAQSQYETAVATLANILGNPAMKQFTMKDSLKVPSLETVDKIIGPQLQQGRYKLPELEENELNLQKINYQKRVTLGENLPSLALTGDLYNTSYKKSDVFDGTSQSWSVGVTLNIPLFSGFSTLYQMRTFASQETQLILDRQNVENQLTLQQVSSRKTLESAEKSILSGEVAVRLGKASSEEARRNYRYATIDFLQFLQVQNSYMQAESSLNTYKYNYLVALSKYFVASGQPLMNLIDLLEEINK